MTDPTFARTIDWNEHWREADDDALAHGTPSTHHATDAVADFLAETGVPSAFADVGCGPGALALDVAERHPGTDVVGYDAAESVLALARERAREAGVENVAFERAALPAFEPGRQFDVVFSYFTLCYVADVEAALRSLYDAVAPGGYLLFNYQNRLARAHWRTLAEAPHEHLDDSSGFDPETFAERFELLVAGENLLSYERIHEVLGTWPRSVWSVVEKPDVRWAWRHHPLVFVPK